MFFIIKMCLRPASTLRCHLQSHVTVLLGSLLVTSFSCRLYL